MQDTIEIECPRELLPGLHLDADQFADLIKEETAVALFRDGRLSSGMAASWPGACRTLGADSENRPRRDHFLTNSQGNSRTIAQEIGEKWAGGGGLQPVIPKSDRLLGVPRAHFLLKAMRTGGANLLDNNEDDFRRESLLVQRSGA